MAKDGLGMRVFVHVNRKTEENKKESPGPSRTPGGEHRSNIEESLSPSWLASPGAGGMVNRKRIDFSSSQAPAQPTERKTRCMYKLIELEGEYLGLSISSPPQGDLGGRPNSSRSAPGEGGGM